MPKGQMKFTLSISLSDDETEFFASSYEEAKTKARDIFWDNIGVSLTHNSNKGNIEVELPM